jgi:hypothetical protein
MGHQGARSGYTNSRIVAGEPPDHALGRSRGGLTTKIHALSDLSCTPVMALLSAGQAGERWTATGLRRPGVRAAQLDCFGDVGQWALLR